MSEFRIVPQEGFQMKALSTDADIAILGGAAGSGKTFVLLMEFLRHIENPYFGGVIFRRTTPQIKNEGGLWDTSASLYPKVQGEPKESSLQWAFPSGAKLKFSHMEYDKNKLDWQGSQVPFIGFDELTHFEEGQFWYMLSRNRSASGVPGYIRATCNPDPNSWVATFIEWWINQETGFPIPERDGVVRYFARDNGVIVWGDTREEVEAKVPHLFESVHLKNVDRRFLIKSATFIAGTIYENKELMKNDPSYLGNLLSLDEEEKGQLLEGNWKVSVDGKNLVNSSALKEIYDNYPDTVAQPLRCITCDAARYGRDFCVIWVWKGFEVMQVIIYLLSDSHDIKKAVEEMRRKFGVMRNMVLVDQDGVGGGAVKLGGYRGFNGGAPAIREKDNRIKENYKNLKTQCTYRMANRINEGGVRLNINNETCIVYDSGKERPNYSTKIKRGQKLYDVRDMIKADINTWRRKDRDMEGKLQIIDKAEQKTILGRSPDFGDTMLMREYFELAHRPKSFGASQDSQLDHRRVENIYNELYNKQSSRR